MALSGRTLLIEPYRYVREAFEGEGNIAIYDHKTVVCDDASGRTTFAVEHPVNETFDMLDGIDLDDVKARIQAISPVFFRWMGESDTYEDNQRSYLLFVLRLTEVLRRLDIAQAIFFTGVAHHIEYSLIEIACRLVGVKQVFLYPMPFGTKGRLLPVVVHQSIGDRDFLGAELSDVDFRDDVVAYRDNHLARRVPKQNESISGPAVRRSYAFFKLVEREARQWAKTIMRRRSARTHLIDRRKGYGFTATARIINRQAHALAYYASRAISNEETERLIASAGTLPLIYAHYQPEASTFPEGGAVHSHLDLALAIRASGYKGPILYKEHPGSWIYYSKITGFSLVGIARSEEYYQQLEAIGCIFLQPRFRPSDSMMKQVLPITITGSIAVERSLTGWRTCCGGEPWFKQMPGVTSIEEFFGPHGIFYDPDSWQIDGTASIDWFASKLSNRTMTNYPGIGTGAASADPAEQREFLGQLKRLIGALAASAGDTGTSPVSATAR